ncbi:MAG: TonB-dependent receptor [Hydrogenophilaceae bacterium]|jgi:iron complex outermembrane receptor protein|nr:TonB-dependent receptor [Hydrogenophilaceae bacterium]
MNFRGSQVRAIQLMAATALSGAFTAVFCSPALAQTPEPAAEQSDEIVVTAQRRNESLVDVPISVSTVSGADLIESGVGGMESLANVVPGLRIDSSGAFYQPSVRGVGTAIAGAGASANVATYVDGIYKPNALANDFEFIDIASIQVLKGPQGTLFGRNATGGAILVTTRQPSFEQEVAMQASYGSFNTFGGSMFLTDGVTDNLAVSLAVGGSRSDGWIHNTFTDRSANPIDEFTARLKFLYEMNANANLTLSIDAFSIDDPTLYAVGAFNGWSNAAFFGVPLSVNNPREVDLEGDFAHVARGAGASLRGEFDLGWATLTSYTSGHWDTGNEYTNQTASRFPTDGTPPSSPAVQLIVTSASWNYTQNTYSQEFNLSGVSGNFDWVTGLFFYYDKTTYSPFNLSLYGPLGPGGILEAPFPWPDSSYINTGDTPFSAFSGIQKSYAAFADVTYNAGPWHFTLGGRYSIDSAGVEFTSYPQIANGFNASSGLSDDENFYSFTPRAVVRYEITPSSNVYISYAQGTKSGLFNSSGYLAQQTPVQPEEINSIEAGYKIDGGSWRLEASVFDYDYQDLQVATYIGGAAFFQNASSAEIYGADIHWAADLTDAFSVDVGVAYTHARYVDFPDAALQVFDPVFGVVNGTTDVSNFEMQRTPELSGTLGLNFHTPMAGGMFEWNANYSYRSETSFDFARTLTQDGYGLLSTRLAWSDPDAKWTFALAGTNLTDEEFLVQVLPNAGGFGAVYGKPASVMFQVSYER